MTEFPRELLDWPTDPAAAALVLDFDGTLAPIVDDPAAARLPSRTAASVAELAQHLGRVAIVSGRPADFLQRWAPIPSAVLVGLYGLERVQDGSVIPHPRAAAYTDQIHSAKAELSTLVGEWPGSELEDKGQHAAAVHWRQAERRDDAGQAIREAVQAIAGRRGLHAEDGKMVVEIRPPIDTDKGTAVADLVEGFAEMAFAGDDLGDLPALAVVRERGGLAIAVDHGAETDPRIHQAATAVLDGTDGLAAWLHELAQRLR